MPPKKWNLLLLINEGNKKYNIFLNNLLIKRY